MRKYILDACVMLLFLVALPVWGEIGTIDDVPAATLLLPYFECELGPDLVPVPHGKTTLFSINNASATAQLAHVTLWTDESIPTLDFDVYLTGYDVQTLNVCDIFNGNLPVTASAGQDPTDAISPNPGPAMNPPADINIPACAGRLPYVNPAVKATLLNHIRNAHTGGPSTVFGNRCSGFDYGDRVARGYITVDATSQCSLDFPSTPGYFSGIAAFDNVLWGDFVFVNSVETFALGEALVHIEACGTGTVPGPYTGFVGTGTSGVDSCPFGPGDRTFYSRYVGGLGTDQREALGTLFAARYLNGGAFDGGTTLCVWRDATTPVGDPGAANGAHDCDDQVSWFPLGQQEVVVFDEQESSAELCVQEDDVSPPIGGVEACFPLETQCVSLQDSNIPGADLKSPFAFGWMMLDLNRPSPPFPAAPNTQTLVMVIAAETPLRIIRGPLLGGRKGVIYKAVRIGK